MKVLFTLPGEDVEYVYDYSMRWLVEDEGYPARNWRVLETTGIVEPTKADFAAVARSHSDYYPDFSSVWTTKKMPSKKQWWSFLVTDWNGEVAEFRRCNPHLFQEPLVCSRVEFDIK